MKNAYKQIFLLAIVVILIIILEGCSSNKAEKQREVVIHELRISRMVDYDIKKAIEDIREIIKNDALKGSDYWCQMIAPGMSMCRRYDASSPQKKTLNQPDIDRNKNNRLQ